MKSDLSSGQSVAKQLVQWICFLPSSAKIQKECSKEISQSQWAKKQNIHTSHKLLQAFLLLWLKCVVQRLCSLGYWTVYVLTIHGSNLVLDHAKNAARSLYSIHPRYY
jgi:hypothetical protein